MKSNNLHQMEIPLRHQPQVVDIELVKRQKSLGAAIQLCVQLSGFESDKQVYMELGIDASHWTRILKGSAHFPQDKLTQLMNVCDNEVPLIWLANKCGYELKPLQSTLEKELEQEREEKAELQKKLQYLTEFVGITK